MRKKRNSSFLPEEAGDDWKTALTAISSGQLQLEKQITHKLPFEDLERGLLIMRDKTEYYNKVMIVQ